MLEPKACKRIPSVSTREREGALIAAALKIPHATEALHSFGEDVAPFVQILHAPMQFILDDEVAAQSRPR